MNDMAWLAGLLEGEGWFGWYRPSGRKGHSVMMMLEMTDKDIIERAASIMHTKVLPVRTHKDRNRQDTWRTQAYAARARGIMMSVYPWMGKRRQARMTELFLGS